MEPRLRPHDTRQLQGQQTGCQHGHWLPQHLAEALKGRGFGQSFQHDAIGKAWRPRAGLAPCAGVDLGCRLGGQWSRPELTDEIRWLQQQRGPLGQPTVTASSRKARCIARYNPERQLLIPGKTCGMKRPTALRAFHQYYRAGQGHLETIASREVTCADGGARRLLRDQQPLRSHLGLQHPVMAGINPLQRRTKHRHGPPPLAETTAMASGVDAIGEATDHRPARLSQGTPQSLCHGQAMAGRPTGTDHSHRLPAGEPGPERATTAPVESQRRAVEIEQLGRCRWIARQENTSPAGDLARPGLKRPLPPAQSKRSELRTPVGTQTAQNRETLERSRPGQLKTAEMQLERPHTRPAQPRTVGPQHPPQAPAPIPWWPSSLHRPDYLPFSTEPTRQHPQSSQPTQALRHHASTSVPRLAWSALQGLNRGTQVGRPAPQQATFRAGGRPPRARAGNQH